MIPVGDFVYSQSMSGMTSFSENDMNIRIPFYNVPHLNGILRNISEKDALTEQKKLKYLGND